MSTREEIPSPDPVSIGREYQPQFAASEALLRTIWSALPRRGRNDLHLMLMNLLGRSIGTYRALLHLLRGGFTDQAWMLNRSLFEDLIFAWWCALPENRDSAPQLVQQQVASTDERIDYLLGRIEAGGLDALAERGDAEKEWVGRSPLVKGLQKTVKQIEPLWIEHGGSIGELHAQHEIAHWRANLALHTSGKALTDSLMRGAIKLDDGYLYRYGQTSRVEESEMIHAFAMGAFRLGWLARLLLIESKHQLDELERAYRNVQKAAKDLTPTKLRQLGRNEPCWCGSGAKFKRCHGSGASGTPIRTPA